MDYQKIGVEIEFNKDEDFYRRVKFALAKAAVAILKENPATANHVQRVSFAVKITEGNYNLIPLMYVICTDSTIEAANRLNAITDAQLLTATNSLFDVLAGIG